MHILLLLKVIKINNFRYMYIALADSHVQRGCALSFSPPRIRYAFQSDGS
jgi:hypothetical protein